MIHDMGIAGLILRFRKKVKTNVEVEYIFYYWKSSDRATVSNKLSSVLTFSFCNDLILQIVSRQ